MRERTSNLLGKLDQNQELQQLFLCLLDKGDDHNYTDSYGGICSVVGLKLNEFGNLKRGQLDQNSDDFKQKSETARLYMYGFIHSKAFGSGGNCSKESRKSIELVAKNIRALLTFDENKQQYYVKENNLEKFKAQAPGLLIERTLQLFWYCNTYKTGGRTFDVVPILQHMDTLMRLLDEQEVENENENPILGQFRDILNNHVQFNEDIKSIHDIEDRKQLCGLLKEANDNKNNVSSKASSDFPLNRLVSDVLAVMLPSFKGKDIELLKGAVQSKFQGRSSVNFIEKKRQKTNNNNNNDFQEYFDKLKANKTFVGIQKKFLDQYTNNSNEQRSSKYLEKVKTLVDEINKLSLALKLKSDSWNCVKNIYLNNINALPCAFLKNQGLTKGEEDCVVTAFKTLAREVKAQLYGNQNIIEESKDKVVGVALFYINDLLVVKNASQLIKDQVNKAIEEVKTEKVEPLTKRKRQHVHSGNNNITINIGDINVSGNSTFVLNFGTYQNSEVSSSMDNLGEIDENGFLVSRKLSSQDIEKQYSEDVYRLFNSIEDADNNEIKKGYPSINFEDPRIKAIFQEKNSQNSK